MLASHQSPPATLQHRLSYDIRAPMSQESSFVGTHSKMQSSDASPIGSGFDFSPPSAEEDDDDLEAEDQNSLMDLDGEDIPANCRRGSKSSHQSGPGGASTKGKGNFVNKLYQILDNPGLNPHISWGDNGVAFTITNTDEFTAIEMGDKGRFKAKTFASFVRQLNMYGFSKKNRAPRSRGAGGDQCQPATFEHSEGLFQRGRPELIIRIKRKAPDAPGQSSPPSHAQSNYSAPMSPIQFKSPSDTLSPPPVDWRQAYDSLSKRYDLLDRTVQGLQYQHQQMEARLGQLGGGAGPSVAYYHPPAQGPLQSAPLGSPDHRRGKPGWSSAYSGQSIPPVHEGTGDGHSPASRDLNQYELNSPTHPDSLLSTPSSQQLRSPHSHSVHGSLPGANSTNSSFSMVMGLPASPMQRPIAPPSLINPPVRSADTSGRASPGGSAHVAHSASQMRNNHNMPSPNPANDGSTLSSSITSRTHANVMVVPGGQGPPESTTFWR